MSKQIECPQCSGQRKMLVVVSDTKTALLGCGTCNETGVVFDLPKHLKVRRDTLLTKAMKAAHEANIEGIVEAFQALKRMHPHKPFMIPVKRLNRIMDTYRNACSIIVGDPQ